MHNSLKIIKTLLYSYIALHVSGTLAPIIRSLLILAFATVVTDQSWKIQPTQRHTVTGGCMCRIRRLLMMGAFATVVTDQSWKIQPTQRHTVTGGCMCRIRRLLMMGARVPETCRAK